jgi:hypothetical protein
MTCRLQYIDGTDVPQSAKRIDKNSVILDKNDCMLFLRPVCKGMSLKEADMGLDKVAPLIYDLEIPVDMYVPPDTLDQVEFITKTFAILASKFDTFVLEQHRLARDDDASFFASYVEVFDINHSVDSVSWHVFAFKCHRRDLDYITGIDNLSYINVSKRLDQLGYLNGGV